MTGIRKGPEPGEVVLGAGKALMIWHGRLPSRSRPADACFCRESAITR